MADFAHTFRCHHAARIRYTRHRRQNPARGPDAYAIGRVFGSIVAGRGGSTVAVGYDGRLSSPELEPKLVQGLVDSGIEVLRIGRGPTPMLYFAAVTQNTDGGIMVTGSHNPPDYNGFKMVLANKPFFRNRHTGYRRACRRRQTWSQKPPAVRATWMCRPITGRACCRIGMAAIVC